MFNHLSMTWQNRLEIAFFTGLSTLAIIAWAWFLRFPWDYAFKAIVIFQVLAYFYINWVKFQASKVNGASGWSFLVFFGFQAIFVAIMSISRGVIWLLHLRH